MRTGVRKQTWIVLISLLVAGVVSGGCGDGNGSDPDPETGSAGRSLAVTLPAESAWVSTGYTFYPREVLRVAAGERALGADGVVENDPLPYVAHRRLLGRIGERGRPFPIGRDYRVSGNSLNAGEYFYVGWNDRDFLPPGDTEEEWAGLDIQIEISSTDGAPLLSPIDGMWSDDQNPLFNWDEIDDVYQYKIEVSRYPDFRILEVSNTTSFTSVSFVEIAYPGIPGTDQEQQEEVQLDEGVYYWRVRAQLNTGRTLAPNFGWTDWSLVFRYGVELGSSPEPPEIMSPESGVDLEEGEPVLFEFTQQPDPSGVLWRYRNVKGACGSEPTIDPDDPASGDPTGWMVFPCVIEAPNPTDEPPYYAYFDSPELDRGEWFFRVEVRDGDDFDEERVSGTDFRASIGCEEYPGEVTDEVIDEEGEGEFPGPATGEIPTS